MRGRVSSVNNLFIGTSNELGGAESGIVSHLSNPVRWFQAELRPFWCCGSRVALAGDTALRPAGATCE